MSWESATPASNQGWDSAAEAKPKTQESDWNTGNATASNDSWDTGAATAASDSWNSGTVENGKPAEKFNNGFGSGDARNYTGAQDDANGADDEEAWGQDRPAPRDLSDMKCYNCQGIGHGSRTCPESPREREVRPLIDWSHHPEVPSEEAWTLLKQADASRDLDDIKEAFEVYAKNTPDATFQSIEQRLRAEEMNLRLVCLEKEIPMNKTNVNLQMEADKKYVVGYQLTVKSRRTKMNDGMYAETYEENFERLADCGFTVASSIPVCYNCNQKGHVGKNCPEDRLAPEDRDMSHVVKVVCSNCEQEGHRLRTCPEPRKVRSKGCRNCGSEEHMVAECDQPKRPRKGESCYNCGSELHYGKDCTEEKKPRPDTRECYNCQQSGHIGKDCPEPRKPRAHREAAPVVSDYPEPVAETSATDFGNADQEWNTNEAPTWQTSSAPAVTAGGW